MFLLSKTTICAAVVASAGIPLTFAGETCTAYAPIYGGNQCGPTDPDDPSGYFISDKASFPWYENVCVWGICAPKIPPRGGSEQADFTSTCSKHDQCYQDVGACPVDCDAKLLACNNQFRDDLTDDCNSLPYGCQRSTCHSAFRDVYSGAVYAGATYYKNKMGCGQKTAVSYKVYHNVPALCSDGAALVETDYSGETYGSSDNIYGQSTNIMWKSMVTTNPSVTATCNWHRNGKSDTWLDTFVGYCGVAPSALQLPSSSAGMASHHVEYIVEHSLPNLCSNSAGKITVKTRYIGEKCNGNSILWTSMQTLNPANGMTSAGCSWQRSTYSGNAAWLDSYMGMACGDSPTVVTLPTSV